MRAPYFWYDNSSLVSYLFYPFGEIYRVVGALRRKLATPYKAKIPVICVGNITCGGAGKTPLALAIAEILKAKGNRPVFVSRGYKGREKGPILVDPFKHDSTNVGDEPLLLAKKAPCWIGKNRAATVQVAEEMATHIILDDGLQNPAVKHSLSFLVIDGEIGLGNGRIIPAGPLRESLFDVLPRVDAVIIVGDDICGIEKRIKENFYAREKSFFHAFFVSAFKNDSEKKYLAFAGIGRPEKFFNMCKKLGLDIVETKEFPDHHFFSEKDLKNLTQRAREKNLQLITTEKDYVRLPRQFLQLVEFIPVRLKIVEEELFFRLFN